MPGSFVGASPPAPTTGGRVIYFERIGADLTPDQDFGPNALPVIAILNPDGTGSWVRLPDDWDVVASDVWGTVLMRRTDTELEFAFLDDALEASATSHRPGVRAGISPCADDIGVGAASARQRSVGGARHPAELCVRVRLHAALEHRGRADRRVRPDRRHAAGLRLDR